jgi:predicted  nucleic acid-binding Zn-ribbon protein
VSGGPSIEERRAELQYRRERLALYRARMYGGRAESQSRLRELERAVEGAQTRLADAEREAARPVPKD